MGFGLDPQRTNFVDPSSADVGLEVSSSIMFHSSMNFILGTEINLAFFSFLGFRKKFK